jgi:hypothetical protein
MKDVIIFIKKNMKMCLNMLVGGSKDWFLKVDIKFFIFCLLLLKSETKSFTSIFLLFFVSV